jgi:hypothetical protein
MIKKNKYFFTLGLLNNYTFAGSCSTLDCIFNSMVSEVQSIPVLLNYIVYIGALTFAYKGVLKLKEFNESKGQVKITNAILYFLASGLLFGLPKVVQVGRSTVGLI